MKVNLICFLAALCLLIGGAVSDVINVDNNVGDLSVGGDNLCSLREAIQNANSGTATNVDCESPLTGGIVDDPVVIRLPAFAEAANLDAITVNIELVGSNSVVQGYTTGDSIFTVASGGSLHVGEGITVQNGQSEVDRTGGCFTVESEGSLSLEGVVVQNCRWENEFTDIRRSGAGAVFVEENGAFQAIDCVFQNNIGIGQSVLNTPSPLPTNFTAGAISLLNATQSLFENCVFHLNQGEVGAVYSYLDVQATGSSFTNNTAVYSGGAIFTNQHLNLRDVGDVFGNSASNDGGAFFATGDITIDYVGDVVHNEAGDNGGFACAANGQVLIGEIRGDVEGNKAEDGGAIHAATGIEIDHIEGSIVENQASNLGGFAFSARNYVIIKNVQGSINNNHADIGGVVYSAQDAIILENVGPIANNTADTAGGCFFSANRVTIDSVRGSISGNVAAEGVGAVAYASSDIYVFSVAGDISGNVGINTTNVLGAAFSSGQSIYIIDVDGEISDNVNGGAALAFASDSITLRNAGAITQNIGNNGGLLYAGHENADACSITIENIRGGITDNKAVYLGGALASSDNCDIHLQNVNGSISRNGYLANLDDQSSASGLIYGNGVEVLDIQGSISENLGTNGIIYGNDIVRIENIGGDISSNFARIMSGFAYSDSDVSIKNVQGSIVDNHVVAHGAGVAYAFASVVISDVGGNISANIAFPEDSFFDVSSGVAHAHEGDSLIYNIAGSISNNSGEMAGVSYSRADSVIQDVAGSISGNYGIQLSGVSYSEEASIYIRSIGGSIADNTGVSGASVAYAADGVIVEKIGGSISRNRAFEEEVTGMQAYTFGAFHSASSEGVLIREIGGSIDHNQGHLSSVVYSFGPIVIEDVAGSLSDNLGYYSGIAYAPSGDSNVLISNIAGSLARNTAVSGSPVAEGEGTVFIDNIQGDIINNTVSGNTDQVGGVASSLEGSVVIRNVFGSIIGNECYGAGVAYAFENVDIHDVIGRIENNFGRNLAGVAFAFNGHMYIRRIRGPIASNRAYYGSAIASAQRSVVVDDVDGILHNIVQESTGGVGGFRAIELDVEISNINGDIVGNRGSAGALAYADDGSVLLNNVAGDISDNFAQFYGGVVYADYRSSIRNVLGSISRNQARLFGAVAYGQHGVIVDNVNGDFSENIDLVFKFDGAPLYSSDGSTLIRNVNGSISHNRGGFAGVAYATSLMQVSDIAGDIADNVAGYYAGAFMSSDEVVQIYNIGGSITGNHGDHRDIGSAFVAGVAYAFDEVEVHHVHGDISDNGFIQNNVDKAGAFRSFDANIHIHDVDGSIINNFGNAGGVAYAHDSVVIESIGGDICNNNAFWFGGVAYTNEGDITIRNVQGSICNNQAIFGHSSIASAADRVYIQNIGGDIADNRDEVVWNFFGTISARNEFVSIRDIGGSILRNQGGAGGVAYAFTSASIQNVAGDIAENNAYYGGGVVYARTNVELLNIGGDIRDNHSELRGGGAIYARDAVVVDTTGAIFNNRAHGQTSRGGFVYSHSEVTIRNIAGAIYDNAAHSGGVAYSAFGEVYMSHVSGDILRNSAITEDLGFGGVAYGFMCVAEHIGGSISDNSAFSGGVFYSQGVAHLRDIAGDICRNSAYIDVLSEEAVGGVIFADEEVSILNVGGNICDNTAGVGGIVFAQLEVSLFNIGGDISGNSAIQEGGCVYSFDDVHIQRVTGDISDNYARSGGVVYTRSGEHVLLKDIGGSITRNSAGKSESVAISNNNGGVVYAVSAEVSIVNVDGDLSFNSAHNGGVVYASNNEVNIDTVSGSVNDNFATQLGGVAVSTIAFISDVGGSIYNNRASQGSGGVLYSLGSLGNTGESKIQNVGGDIRHNSAHSQASGGVMTSNGGYAFIHNVAGSIFENDAGIGGVIECMTGLGSISNVNGNVNDNYARTVGGVIASDHAEIIDVNGFITSNAALINNGGVLYTSADAIILNTGLGICGNTAGNNGGVIYTELGNAVIRHHLAKITQNEAKAGNGSVIYLNNQLGGVILGDIESGKGVISQNVDSQGSGTFGDEIKSSLTNPAEHLVRGIEILSTASLVVDFQPADNAEANQFIDPYPSVNVTGVVVEEVPLNFRIEVVPVDAPPYVYPHPLQVNILPNGGYAFPNLTLPSGQYSLRIQLIGGCDDDIVLAEDETEVIDVSGCSDPRPIVCPAEEIVVESGVFTCDAFVVVPDIQSSIDCDNAQYSNSFNSESKPFGESGPGTATDNYPVGSTDFELSVSSGGSTFNCPMRVTVSDISPPSRVTCPLPITAETAAGQCSASVTVGLPVTVDNCPITSITNTRTTTEAATDVYPVGTHDIVYVVGNNGPSGSCDTQVTVVDSEPPVITCPSNIVTACTDAEVHFQVFTSDNCDYLPAATPVGDTLPSGSIFPGGVTTQVFSTVDSAGNTATCEFTVTVQSVYYEDNDGDGFGDETSTGTVFACNPPAGFSLDNTDCNDQNSEAWRVWFIDFDGDGFGDPAFPICSDANATVPDAFIATLPAGSDVPSAVFGDVDDSFSFDCDDSSPFIFPGAPEVCDDRDNNCDGLVDEGLDNCPLPGPPPPITITVENPVANPVPIPFNNPVPVNVPVIITVPVQEEISTTSSSAVRAAPALLLAFVALIATFL